MKEELLTLFYSNTVSVPPPQPAKVTVVVRVRSPEGGLAAGVGKNIGVFPAVGGPDTIIVDRDGSEARYALLAQKKL